MVSPTVPEVQTGDGLERTYEGLETKPNGYDPPTLVVDDEGTMPLHSTSKRRRLGLALVAIGVLVALAVGLGVGLGSRRRYVSVSMSLKRAAFQVLTRISPDSNSSQRDTSTDDRLLELFNSTTPLPRSDVKPNDWRGRSIYQIITDRFSPSNSTMPCDVAKQQYCGGTWQGIINRLDYIQNMGFTAVCLSLS